MRRHQRVAKQARNAQLTQNFFGSSTLVQTRVSESSRANLPAPSSADITVLFRQPCLGSQEYENAGKVFDAMATALTDELSGLLEESQVKEESSGLLDEPQVNEESSGLPDEPQVKEDTHGGTAFDFLDLKAATEAIQYLSDGATTFDLNNLECPTLKYESIHNEYIERMDRILNEDRTSSSSAKTTKADQLQQLAISDKTFQITQAKAALVQHECSIRNEVLLSFLRRAQLFNIEKRYASADEAYIALKIEDQKRLKNVHFEGAIPSSFRQKWNDPTLLIAEQSSGAPPTKKLNALSALAKLQQHTKAATKEIAAIKGTIAAAEELKMPEVPSNLVHYGASIPTTITQEIRQGMHDLQFLFSEVTDLQEKLLVQSDAIKTTFFVWISGGTDCWNYGKTRVHELESLRKYEYDRNSLLASCYVAMRKDSWIHAHFKSEQGAGDLTPEIARCLELETRDPALFWNTKTALLRRAINSVDELMAEADKVQKAYSEGASAQEIRAQFPLWYTPGG